jgi:hypothetical protein
MANRIAAFLNPSPRDEPADEPSKFVRVRVLAELGISMGQGAVIHIEKGSVVVVRREMVESAYPGVFQVLPERNYA